MPLGAFSRMDRHPNLHSGMAVFFLLFALVDLGAPMPCCLDGVVAVTASVVDPTAMGAAHEHDHGALETDPAGGEHESPAPPTSTEENCFCCARVLVSTPFSAEIAAVKLGPNEPRRAFMPSSPPRSPFHPPRFA